MNGGYAMIDCTGVDLGDLGKVAGLHSSVKSAVKTNKPIILYGIVNGTQEFTPITAFGGEDSTSSVFLSFFPVTIHIDSDDNVTM